MKKFNGCPHCKENWTVGRLAEQRNLVKVFFLCFRSKSLPLSLHIVCFIAESAVVKTYTGLTLQRVQCLTKDSKHMRVL